jgi:hypothetical protein
MAAITLGVAPPMPAAIGALVRLGYRVLRLEEAGLELTTAGLLSVVAKDADCTTLVDPTTRYVDADPAMAGVQELEHWQALYGYVSRSPNADADGIPDVPSVYAAAQGRIVRE